MITATGPHVPGIGPVPCTVMLVGEAPGFDEAHWMINGQPAPTPFVGPSGVEQDRFLMQNGMHRRRIYITNLIKRYIDGNTDPTPDDIAANEPELFAELRRVRPAFILAVGAYSTRWFLGDVDMESVHGLPYRVRKEVVSAVPCCAETVVIPCYHPAYGLRDSEAKTLVFYDYQQAAKIVRGEIPATQTIDEWPDPVYTDAGPEDLARCANLMNPHFAADVEGPLEPELRGNYWGFSISFDPGVGLVFRKDHPQFRQSVEWLNGYIKRFDPLVVYHNAMGIDIETMRLMGIKGHDRRVYDTMVAAFFLRVEPQGLKALARRLCGMEMRDYGEVIGDAARVKQEGYLFSILEHSWGKPEPRLVQENDGTSRIYTPQPIGQRVERIISDLYAKPSDTGMWARYKAIGAPERSQIETVLGPFPQATLDDVPRESAVAYSGRDPDATLRVKARLAPKIAAMQLDDRLQLDLDILPILEEMQASGIPASRKYFEELSARMWDRMMQIGSHISSTYNEGQPFNPASAPQVSALAKSRGLKGVKKTKTGKVSTAKKSMEHLRTKDTAMDAIFTWREHQKIKDSFADPIVERMPGADSGVDIHPIRCTIRTTRVTSDRISATDPNLTAMPVASDLGLLVREGFVAPPGYLFGSGDASQIEMRVMAHLSKDETLIRLFHERRDIHAETATTIFGLPKTGYFDKGKGDWVYPDVHKMKQRNPTKRAGFGIITGTMGPGLLDQLRMMGCEGWTLTDDGKDVQSDDLKYLIREWFKVYPGVKGFIQQCRNQAYQHGMVREMGGFPRYLPGVYSEDFFVRAEAERQSHSHIISGSAQWMLRRAMRWLKPQIAAMREDDGVGAGSVRWLMQIHDELIFCFPEELEGAMRELVLDALRNHQAKLRVPLEASWAAAKTWGKLK